MARKAKSRITLEGIAFEGRLRHAKELFGSHNYRIYLQDERLAFECVASPAQVMEAWYAKADCAVDPFDLTRQKYLPCSEEEDIMDLAREEQFIRCVYWLLRD